jgi:hypothetical protein
MEGIVGNLLRGAVLLAAVVVLGGGLVYLMRYGATAPIIVCSMASPRISGGC